MSLSENLYNLGILMKTNLEKRGVVGLTGNEGLTTLTNKMLDNLTLMGFPQVIQKNETSYIGMKLIASGNPVANQTFSFDIKPFDRYCANYNAFSQLFTENSLGGRGYKSKDKIIRFTTSGNTQMSFISDAASDPYLTETLSKGEYMMAFYNSPFNLFEVVNDKAVFVKNISAPSGDVWFDFEKNSSNNNITNIRINERIRSVFGQTNKNGIATIPYVGTGRGGMTAEVKIYNGDVFLKGTCEIFDTLFYDRAIPTNYNNTWENYNNRLNISREQYGTLLKNTSDTNGYWIATRDPPSKFAVEFDVVSINGNAYINYNTNNKIRLDTRVTNGDHVKLEYDNGSTDIYVNNSLVDTVSTSELTYIAFMIYPSYTIKYKEFMIYPINIF